MLREVLRIDSKRVASVSFQVQIYELCVCLLCNIGAEHGVSRLCTCSVI